jgi:hypothetical protein
MNRMSFISGGSLPSKSGSSSSINKELSETLDKLYEDAGVRNGSELKDLVARKSDTNDQLKKELGSITKLQHATSENIKIVLYS